MKDAMRLQEQAEQLEILLPLLIRRLFTLKHNHPVAELPLAQLRACMILQDGPRTLSALSEELDISVSAVTQLADRLERAGLVERIAESGDRRVKNLQLTPAGTEIMRSRREIRIRHARKALERLEGPQREAALCALESLLEASLAVSEDTEICLPSPG